MRIFRSFEEARGRFEPSAVTIGNFDGLHAGHRALIARTVEMAGRWRVKPSAMTFHPHPQQVVAPERAPRLLTTPEERAALMEPLGIQQMLISPFDRGFSSFSPVEFAGSVLREALGARAVIVGENFRFGRRQGGDTGTLRELGSQFGFDVEVVAPVRRRGRLVSSSEIRRLVAAGEVGLAARLLEHPYAVEGAVIRGAGRGARQTVPTLNLADHFQVLPADGVYITRALDPGSRIDWPAVTNIGYRPTFGGTQRTIETHLLAPLDGPPPSRLRVEFLRRLRDEVRFDSPLALKARILRDVRRAEEWFRRCERWVRPEQPD
jgi:riboflavin kinase/FMN adenylyltransferase